MRPANPKKPLFDGDLPLPDHLGWEQMEDGILRRMQKDQPPPPKRPLIRFLSLILLLLWLAVLSWDVTDNEGKQQDSRPEAAGLTSEVAQPSVKVEPSSSAAITTKEFTGTARNNITPPVTTPRLQSGTLGEKPATSLVKTEEKPVGQSVFQLKDEKIITRNERAIAALPAAIHRVEAPGFLPRLPATTATSDPIRPVAPRRWQLAVRQGVNSYQNGYAGANTEYVNRRRDTEINDIGTQFELRLERRLGSKYLIGVGIGHHTYRRRLEASFTHRFTRSIGNVLTRYNLNPLTGDTTQRVYSDTSITVTQRRAVRHHNRIRSWEIPVYLGYRWQLGRFGAEATGGVALSIRRRAAGRVFDADGELRPLDATQFVRLDYGTAIHFTGEARLTYRLTQRLDFSAQVGYQRSLSNWLGNGNNALISRPVIWRMGTGVRYRF